MSKNIRLSEKHGLNPSLGMCFWCGEPDVVILFGRLPGDEEAPRRISMNYNPCKKCQELQDQGIWFIRVKSPDPKLNERELVPGAVPTGQWVVIKREWIEREIKPIELREQILHGGKALILDEEWEKLGLPSAREAE